MWVITLVRKVGGVIHDVADLIQGDSFTDVVIRAKQRNAVLNASADAQTRYVPEKPRWVDPGQE